MELSLCVPVYRAHRPPNAATVAAALPGALGGLAGELVVALNGIRAGEAGIPEEGVRTVALDQNLGVAPGWNAAAREAHGKILAFGNDDVELGPGSLELLARVLREHPEAGVVGPVGANWDRRNWRHSEFVHPDNGVVECDALSGFLFAVRRDVYDAVGGFDEAFAPASWEEIDFSWAVRALGLKCYAVGGVDATHEWGISAGQPPWRTIRWGGRRELLWSIHRRNRRHFVEKWAAR